MITFQDEKHYSVFSLLPRMEFICSSLRLDIFHYFLLIVYEPRPIFRPPTLYGVPKDHKPFHLGEAESFREQKNIFAAFIPESKYVEPPSEAPNLSHGDLTVPETSSDGFAFPAASKDDLGAPEPTTDGFGAPELPSGGLGDPEPSGSGLVAEEPSIGGFAAPEPRIGSFDGLAVSEPSIVSPSNQNLEEVNSWHDLGSRMTASIGCAKLASDVDDTGKELQCTADSSKVSALPRPEDPSPSFIQDNRDAEVQKHAGVQALSVPRNDVIGGSSGMSDSLPRGKEKEKKKDEKRKRDGHKGHRDDPEYLERKRIKKVKKPKEKEMAKLLNERAKVPSAELPSPQLCNSNRSSPVDPTS
ncbi:transcription initiation factor TFIID subunit 2-like isoform X2 [Malus domestica]|uniref:transcription initiation factor TFIID subunit 2-like isoform X2 n=1 Tax=Malus domestica TaxID=3750 RepID=UPI0010AAE6ED|nr:transcription initiation factor TFIID subunit 2-like isoform X2 [Malus domestica]